MLAIIVLTVVFISSEAAHVNAQTRSDRVTISNDGWNLIADLVIPRSRRRVPGVVLLNKANGNRQVYLRLAEQLATAGIASIRVDLRGHGESINRGRFVPFQENASHIMNGADTDIWAVTQYFKKLKPIDAARIGFVGASYSGEEMVVSARKNGSGRAYVALSPGSFSDESLAGIDGKAHWLFVRSSEERSMRTFLDRLHASSKTSQFFEVPGTKHATDILESYPEIADMIAAWLKHKL